MQLLVLRHGQAEPLNRQDADRALTAHGRAQVDWICGQRAQELSRVRAIWASPFLRTQQTAAIVSERLGLPVITESLLLSETAPQQLFDRLSEIKAAEFPLLLVSHQPLVGNLVNGLCGSGNAHPLTTASLACLESDVWANGCADLQWLQHPEA